MTKALKCVKTAVRQQSMTPTYIEQFVPDKAVKWTSAPFAIVNIILPKTVWPAKLRITDAYWSRFRGAKRANRICEGYNSIFIFLSDFNSKWENIYGGNFFYPICQRVTEVTYVMLLGNLYCEIYFEWSLCIAHNAYNKRHNVIMVNFLYMP